MLHSMTGNVPELSVSELSRALKRTVEDAYGHVRVRGEVSGFKRAGSGHLYMTLKDDQAVLDAVCWRGTAGRLGVTPEDGLEVIATGRLTTYPGRSKYQIVIEQVELAGEGALLKLLEDRRKRLAEEGLFDEARKRPLPFLPEVIGVVTSPTGAVIRDILHRLADRFPRHVLLWPVLVQGDGAAPQVAAAIEGFNALPADGPIPRPDVLIVARGGGSLEDLWAFNEEAVVRAAAASAIPLISAVGHETDTTLIDFASDRRAPTPTAAAEIAVPVRSDLLADLSGFTQRLVQAGGRGLENRARYLDGLARGLPQPRRLLEPAMQRLDDTGDRLVQAAPRLLRQRGQELEARAGRLRSPEETLRRAGQDLEGLSRRAAAAIGAEVNRERRRLDALHAAPRLAAAAGRQAEAAGTRITRAWSSIEALSYKGTLARGYAVVRDDEGRPVTDGAGLTPGTRLDIEFRDETRIAADIAKSDGSGGPASGPKAKTTVKSKPKAKPKAPAAQEELF
jgi:exodeoxyribonuclease VII large subunit